MTNAAGEAAAIPARLANVPLCAWLILLGIMGLALNASIAQGAVVSIKSQFGLMQQPTSHYYHASYGMTVQLASDGEGFLGEASYIERPEFESGGYEDKEYGAFFLVGKKLTAGKDHGLYAALGYGEMGGYLRATSGDAEERSFRIRGPTLKAAYAMRWGWLNFGIEHQTFAGYVNKEQLDGRVAWPYNFYMVNFGCHW